MPSKYLFGIRLILTWQPLVESLSNLSEKKAIKIREIFDRKITNETFVNHRFAMKIKALSYKRVSCPHLI